MTLRVSPWPRSIAWINARPVRPLPSGNGWIVSNCAWAIAACASTGRSSRPANRTRSSISSGTDSWCGGMKSAWCGPNEVPPIQTCSSRQRPAISGCSSTDQRACIARIASASSRSARSSAAASPRRCRRSRWRCVSRAAEFGQRDRLARRTSGSRSTKTRPTPSGATRPQTGPRRRRTRRRTVPSRQTPPRSPREPPRAGQGAGRRCSGTTAARYAPEWRRRTLADDQIGRDPRRPRPQLPTRLGANRQATTCAQRNSQLVDK